MVKNKSQYYSQIIDKIEEARKKIIVIGWIYSD